MKTPSTLKFFFAFFLLISLANPLQAQRGRYDSYYPSRGSSLSLQLGVGSWYGGFLGIAVPPFGLRVNVLPRGYWPLEIGGYPYYYYKGIFYRKNKRDYEVVQAPVGAEVPSIPNDSKTVVINGGKYYEYNGTFFKDHVKPNGELWYTVEGKHGVLNTVKNDLADSNMQPQTDNRPSIGEVFDKLPSDYKTVVINSKRFFVSTDHVYYEEVMDGYQVRYKVAGK
jgi:hypothetical protein